MQIKKLYRCSTHHVLSGVCGGIGEYFAVDPALVRLIYVFVTLISGLLPGVIVYIAAALFIPIKPHA